MTDRKAKNALFLTVVVGAVLGLLWGGLRYGLTDLRAYNLGGLGVILVVSGYAGVYAILSAVARRRRDGPQT
jgi:hypothetical protein